MSKLEEYLKEHREEAYEFARRNTKYNAEGRPTISRDDEWAKETEWDVLFEELKKEREGEEVLLSESAPTEEKCGRKEEKCKE